MKKLTQIILFGFVVAFVWTMFYLIAFYSDGPGSIKSTPIIKNIDTSRKGE
jgi:hypothetical protein